MLKIGDKIKYVNRNVCMEFPIGTVFTVTDIKGNCVAVTADYKVDGQTVGNIKGLMSYDEYEKHFEQYVEEKVNTNSQYTKWETLNYCDCFKGECKECPYCCLCSYQHESNIQYKYNNRKVIAKAKLDNTTLYPNAPDGKVLTVYTSCHPEDTFNLEKGLFVAMEKLQKKIAQQIVKQSNENINKI